MIIFHFLSIVDTALTSRSDNDDRLSALFRILNITKNSLNYKGKGIHAEQSQIQKKSFCRLPKSGGVF